MLTMWAAAQVAGTLLYSFVKILDSLRTLCKIRRQALLHPTLRLAIAPVRSSEG